MFLLVVTNFKNYIKSTIFKCLGICEIASLFPQMNDQITGTVSDLVFHML